MADVRRFMSDFGCADGPSLDMEANDAHALRATLRAVADLLADLAERGANRNLEPSAERRDVSPPCPEPATDYLTPMEYADRRGVSRTTVFGWMRAGLPSVKQGGSRRIRWRDADAFLDAGRLSKAKRRRTP
jgi:predicted DNA-binding transcriptional regulator AlpA